MSDNFTGNPGVGGDVFAADDIAGIKHQRVKVVLGADGVTEGDWASGNPAHVVNDVGVVSTVNSTSTLLGVGGVFTGQSEDALAYATISITVFSDVGSATDGLSIQQSSTGTNWDHIDSYTIPAATGKTFTVGRTPRYFRIVYTNGAVAQTAFRLSVIFNRSSPKDSSIRPQDGRSNDNDMSESVAYLAAFNGTSWDRMRGDTNGLKTQLTALTGSGSLAAVNQAVTLTLNGTKANVSLQVSGTWVGTLIFEASNDNFATAGTTVLGYRAGTGISASSITDSASSNDIYRLTTAAFGYVRVRCSAYTSGTAAIVAYATETTSTAILHNLPTPTDISGSGNFTALNQAVTLSLTGCGSGYVELSGTWVGAVQFEGSLNNFTTSTLLSTTTQSGSTTPSTTPIAANGYYRVLGVTGHSHIRARCSSYTSGTIAVTLKASGANGIQAVVSTNAASFLATVTQAAITKGTQGTAGVTTQDLKDAGRSSRTMTLDSFGVAAITETLNTMSYSTDNGTLTTGTSYTVTAGKVLRLQQMAISLHTITGNTTAVSVIVRIRVNQAGVAIVTSPMQFIIPVVGTATVNQSTASAIIALPDGWEFIAGAGIGFTTTCAGFVATLAAPKVNISIIGYEY